jgi:uncharacterized protein (TIGR00255 family)
MIHSMTAFARAEVVRPSHTVRVEIRSVNSRHLDTAIHLPKNFFELENALQAMVAEKLRRGRVEIRIQIESGEEKIPTFAVNETVAAGYYQALADLKQQLNLKGEVTLDHLIQMGDLIRPVEPMDNDAGCREAVTACLSRGLSDLVAMRKIEGERLAVDINARLGFIEDCLARIKTVSEGLLPEYQKRLKERIRALTGEEVVIDPDRLAREAAFLADKSDISEEIVRADSHLAHFRELMAAETATGRKLNFLLQELHREFNTMGAKTGKADVGHVIVDVKSEIEKIREQVQNVE